MASKTAIAAAFVFALIALVALGQSPTPATAGVECVHSPITEWPVSEGGNGHFYRAVCPLFDVDAEEAHQAAEALGAHLVTLTSQDENDFVFELIGSRGYWSQDDDWCPGPLIGLYEPGDENEPDGGWVWITDEPFEYENWGPDEPGNSGGQDENRAAFGNGDCGVGDVISNEWHDIGEFDEHPSFVIEWDAAPPACEEMPLTQWQVSEGGNGHYYQGVCGTDRISWPSANDIAESQGGHLATLTSEEENQFAFDLIDSPEFWSLTSFRCIIGPWIGAYQEPGSSEPAGGWTWVTGEPFDYTNWSDGEPDNFDNDNRLAFWDGCPGPGRTSEWVDMADGVLGEVTSYIIEWDEAPRLQGDIDCDGEIDKDDSFLLLEVTGELRDPAQSAPCPDVGEPFGDFGWGDVNCDAKVDGLDALFVLLFAALFDPPPPTNPPCIAVGDPIGDPS